MMLVMEPATVNVHDAKTHLSRLLVRVEQGERIIVARDGTPVAMLVPVANRAKRRVPGNDRIVIGPDFDDPLPEFEEL
jgi:prevent-host-death family protein